MDPELQKRIDQAKAEGYSDEEISAALGITSPTKATLPNGPTVPILSAEEKAQFNKSEQQTSDRNTRENIETGLVGAGLAAAGVGVPAAAIYAGKKIFNPAVRAGADLAQRGVGAMESANAINKMGVENLQNRFDVNQANKAAANAPKGSIAPKPMPGVTVGSVAPTYNVPTSNVPQMRMPTPGTVSGPVAPPPSMANRVQAAAAQRITNLPAMGEMLGGAARLAGRALGPLSAVMQTTDTGPAVPSTGRMRGMEINPLTGRPWTPDQIAQYESNPQVFDAQMAPPQMRR